MSSGELAAPFDVKSGYLADPRTHRPRRARGRARGLSRIIGVRASRHAAVAQSLFDAARIQGAHRETARRIGPARYRSALPPVEEGLRKKLERYRSRPAQPTTGINQLRRGSSCRAAFQLRREKVVLREISCLGTSLSSGDRKVRLGDFDRRQARPPGSPQRSGARSKNSCSWGKAKGSCSCSARKVEPGISWSFQFSSATPDPVIALRHALPCARGSSGMVGRMPAHRANCPLSRCPFPTYKPV